MSIDIANLLPGDLIIQYVGTNLTKPDEILGSHAMIFVGEGLGDLPAMVHQIGSGIVYGTHTDVLLPNAPASSDTSATQRKRIVRCKRSDLADTAADYARLWSDRFQIDFSNERAGSSETFENKLRKDWKTPAEVVRVHRRLFDSLGKWRAIKYAARRKGYLCYPGEDDYKGKGMHCSMFAAVCYQVAGLSSVVEAAPDDPNTRVSDKRMWQGGEKALEGLGMNGTDVVMYGAYVRTLQEHDFYDLGKKPSAPKPSPHNIKYVPAASLWRGSTPVSSTNFAALITKGMQVDAKVVKSTSLYQSLCRDPEGWEDLGDLTGEKRPEVGDRTKRLLDRNEQGVQERRRWREG
jgi:hypothetical protein